MAKATKVTAKKKTAASKPVAEEKTVAPKKKKLLSRLFGR